VIRLSDLQQHDLKSFIAHGALAWRESYAHDWINEC